MKYMVLECRLGYAVVLSEDGRFLKIADKNYQIGQTVTDIEEINASHGKNRKWLRYIAAAAACLAVVMTTAVYSLSSTYASVYMAINPEVCIDVNRKDAVVAIRGVNSDGKNLIEGYEYKKKNLELVMDELVDRAIDMGYLHEGGQISLTFDGGSNEWIASRGDTLSAQLNGHLKEKLSVTIAIDFEDRETATSSVNTNDSEYHESDYGKTEMTKPTQDKESDYGDNVTDYEDKDNTDYGKTDYSTPYGQEDKKSDYDD